MPRDSGLWTPDSGLWTVDERNRKAERRKQKAERNKVRQRQRRDEFPVGFHSRERLQFADVARNVVSRNRNQVLSPEF